MINDIWPWNQIEDDRLPPGRPTLVFSPNTEHYRPLRESFNANVFVMVTDPQECTLWNQVPLAVAILGCGSATASTVSLSLPVKDCEWKTLSDAISGLQTGGVHAAEAVSAACRRCDLGPTGSSRVPRWLRQTIHNVASQLPGGDAERTAVAAGLHLLYDDLDGSHSLSQTIEGRGKHQNGDYWHAIMHRREPDYGNAKYWFRRVGLHPVFEKLPAVLEHVQSIYPSESLSQWSRRLVKSGQWDPFAMVDACESACGPQADPEFRRALEELQHFEMLHLLVQSCQDAGFSPPTTAVPAV